MPNVADATLPAALVTTFRAALGAMEDVGDGDYLAAAGRLDEAAIQLRHAIAEARGES